MRIGIDLDGVVFDFVGTLERLYLKWFGFPLAGKVAHWDDPLKLSHFATNRELFDWFERAGGWTDMEMYPGAAGSIDKLLEDGHSIVFITARHGAGADASTDWHEASPWFTSSMLVCTPSKQTVPCTVYIDDGPHIIEQLRDAGKDAIVFNRPWNRKAEGTRAADWPDVLDIIGRLGEASP